MADIIRLAGEVKNCLVSVSNNCGPGHIPQVTGRPAIILIHGGFANPYEWVNRQCGASAVIPAGEGLINDISVDRIFDDLREKLDEAQTGL